jgi:CMP/dCMP kinase
VNRARPIIAIDGPVGAGKSTVARELATALGFTYLNTGAMYRAFAIAARAAGVNPDDPALVEQLAPVLRNVAISFDGSHVMLNGVDVTAETATPEIGDLASRFSVVAPVRERMREVQRALGANGGVVMEGRDIGTHVFPDAEFKFYLDADATIRAQRRYDELAARGIKTNLDQVLTELIERDRRDSARELAPLRAADDAIVIDTTGKSITQVVNELKKRIEADGKSKRT